MTALDNEQVNAQLWQFFKDAGITLEDIADKTGYALGYLVNLMQGRVPVGDRAKFRLIRAFPETAALLLDQPEE